MGLRRRRVEGLRPRRVEGLQRRRVEVLRQGRRLLVNRGAVRLPAMALPMACFFLDTTLSVDLLFVNWLRLSPPLMGGQQP